MSRYVLMIIAYWMIFISIKEHSFATMPSAIAEAKDNKNIDLSCQFKSNKKSFIEKINNEINNGAVYLNISSNKLDDDDFMSINAQIQRNTTLTTLKLDRNKLSKQTLIALGETLTSHQTLRNISIKENNTLHWEDVAKFFENTRMKRDMVFKFSSNILFKIVQSGVTADPYGFIQKRIAKLYEKEQSSQIPEAIGMICRRYANAKFFYQRAKENGCFDVESDIERISNKIRSLSQVPEYFFKKIRKLNNNKLVFSFFSTPVMSNSRPVINFFSTPVMSNSRPVINFFGHSASPLVNIPDIFDPSHALFEYIASITGLVFGYSPELKNDITVLINDIANFREEWRVEAGLKTLKSLVESKMFHEYAQRLNQQYQFEKGEEKPRRHESDTFLESHDTITDYLRTFRTISSKEKYEVFQQNVESLEKIPFKSHILSRYSYFFQKITGSRFSETSGGEISAITDQPSENFMKTYQEIASIDEHPLFNKIIYFANNLCFLSPDIQETGIFLTQKLFNFKQGDILAEAILDYLIFFTKYRKFHEETISAKGLLHAFNHLVDHTTRPNRLVMLDELPPLSSLKVAESFIADPRIALHNCLFRKDDEPFEREEFINSVQYLLNNFQEAFTRGDITSEMCYDDEREVHGSFETLRDLLTNTKNAWEDFSNVNPHNQFANKVIKIANIFKDGTLDQKTMETQLISWASPVLHCPVRSDEEIERFYTDYLKETMNIPCGDDSLEISVALMLADLRYHLFKKLLPLNQTEPLHQEKYLKRKLFKELGLEGYENNLIDVHENVVNSFYKKPGTSSSFKKYILMGADDTAKYKYENTDRKQERYSVPIPAGQGYNNPQTLIDYVCNVINSFAKNKNNRAKKFGSIFSDRIKHYNERNPDTFTDPWEYYDEDTGRMTEQGVTALLYSLGYLEKR